MSVYGEWKAATIASGGISSAEVDLGRDYDYIEIQIPAMDTCTVKIQTAEKTGGTFRDLGSGVTSASGTQNIHDVFKIGGYQYIKVVASASQTSGAVAIRVRGMRY